VLVVTHQESWAAEGAGLVARLGRLLPDAEGIDHIGSTSVPGLPAKDCIDAMVRVRSLSRTDFGAMRSEGFRERPEPWNQEEALGSGAYGKRVFAPPVGGRPVNIHVRETGSPTARYALLFRDYLRADSGARETWGAFKLRLAETATDIYSYGQIKATAQPLLMSLAEQWADANGWQP
jgi:dephospho-CoA kinase